MKNQNQQLCNLKQLWLGALAETVFRKLVNSSEIIPLLEDLQNRQSCLFCYEREKVKQESKLSEI